MAKSKAGKPWDSLEENFLRENYKEMTITEMAKQLKRPYGGVSWKLNQLGLKKTYDAATRAKEGRLIRVVETTSAVPHSPEPVKKPWWKFW